jgi:uncharacterized protein with HEPN domain
LADIVDACDAILEATRDRELTDYLNTRLLRSAVEREFIIVGEAVAGLLRHAPEVATGIRDPRRIVAFRHRLAHEYSVVDDELVWAVVTRDVAPLRAQCAELLARLPSDEGQR